MKKALASLFVAAVVSGTLVGCSTTSTVTPQSLDQIAQGCGMMAGIGVAATPNNSPTVCAAVSNILTQFSMNVASSTNGLTTTFFATYDASIVAAVQGDSHLKDTDKALIQAGSALALTGLDTLFSMHPEWDRGANTINVVVQFFVSGMQQGLNTVKR